MKKWDVVIVGGGPAGSACAITCARAGMQVLVLERARFPRDKVCGDCLNPACWPVLERLGVAEKVRQLSHSSFHSISIVTAGKKEFRFDLPKHVSGETGVRRRDLDLTLLQAAREAGAEVREECAVKTIVSGWEIGVASGSVFADYLVAADGRNSTVARLLNLLPATQKDRVGLQTHLPVPPNQEGVVRMELLPEGYTGGASIGDGLWNLCLVARPGNIIRLKERASAQWNLPATQEWRSITPLSRKAVRPAGENLMLVGDSARVVEPFTGEGIYYALRSGEQAGKCLASGGEVEKDYAAWHGQLYQGRLWVNQLARQAVLHPVLTSRLLEYLPLRGLLGQLTAKVTTPTF